VPIAVRLQWLGLILLQDRFLSRLLHRVKGLPRMDLVNPLAFGDLVDGAGAMWGDVIIRLTRVRLRDLE
jgi:hypothetical protein